MSMNDRDIWDRAYLNEYLGLNKETNIWEYISEKEYQILRPITGNTLFPHGYIQHKKRRESQTHQS